MSTTVLQAFNSLLNTGQLFYLCLHVNNSASTVCSIQVSSSTCVCMSTTVLQAFNSLLNTGKLFYLCLHVNNSASTGWTMQVSSSTWHLHVNPSASTD
jgi:hypothetical protein